MSKIERYTGNLQAFGSAAQGAERTLFGETSQANDLTSQVTSSFLRGWGIVGPSENPSMEDFNAAMYTMSQFIAYQHQMGIPEWDALQEYYSGSICVRNGEAYLSLVDSNIGSAPPSAKWTSVLTAKNALANISGFLKSSNNLSDLANAQTALTNLGLTGIGIGLPTQLAIVNFDFQNFTFTSGANYLTAYNTWLNPPAGVTFNAGTTVSITVDYVTGTQVGLTIIPNTGSQTNYRVFKVYSIGAAGARVFTVREEWNSANPVPISGGGTGGKTAAEALTNLGLGDGSLIPIGVPLPYPLSAAPTGWLKCNGSTFSTTTYPKLALVYPSGVLPDMRGNAIRGWDDGRGVDTGRALLSEQADAIQNITGSFWVSAEKTDSTYATGAFTTVLPAGNCVTSVFQSRQIQRFDFDASHVARTAAETRMRNIAFNHIVRAA
ncbi:phage tail protein [Yersinia mollaretii]|uniref:phage tail protein n=1 Tax=Yersinia mollaretii TaxID=33060 RepID=UPI0021BD3CCD|nr:phage tail protein [Yersinia mollaretii]